MLKNIHKIDNIDIIGSVTLFNENGEISEAANAIQAYYNSNKELLQEFWYLFLNSYPDYANEKFHLILQKSDVMIFQIAIGGRYFGLYSYEKLLNRAKLIEFENMFTKRYSILLDSDHFCQELFDSFWKDDRRLRQLFGDTLKRFTFKSTHYCFFENE